MLINQFLKDSNLPTVSWSTVDGFINRSEIIQRHRRQTKKSGNDDINSTWALARLAQCEQFSEQLELGLLLPNDPEVIQSGLPPMKLHGIAFWDGHHEQVKLGFASKTESLIARNEHGEAAAPLFGGVPPSRMPNTSMKYPGEGRASFGHARESRCRYGRGANGAIQLHWMQGSGDERMGKTGRG